MASEKQQRFATEAAKGMSYERARKAVIEEATDVHGLMLDVHGYCPGITPKRIVHLMTALDTLIELDRGQGHVDRDLASALWSLGAVFLDEARTWKQKEMIDLGYQLARKIGCYFDDI